MKNNKLYILAFAIITFFASCEEVVILDLENAEPRLVIEATIDADAQVIGVLLTQSNGFYDAINLETIEDATIILTKADGSTLDVNYFGNGYYVATNLNINTEEELSILVITSDNKEYRATTYVPNTPTLDSLQALVEERPNFGGGNNEVNFQIFAHWQDEVDVENFYRIRVSKNDTLQAFGYNILDDISRDGNTFSQPAAFQTFESGDTVSVQLLSIDKNSYTYFSDLSAVQGQGFSSTTPFNPNSNFDNNALGYFGIFRSDTETVILQ
jgi:hypothetical protein